MADFNRKKLQVFVSSTFTDLQKERQAAVEAILLAGHIPAGMELFTSGDESQMDVIKQWIDQSDVYVLILGWRYGSIEPQTGKSYTQLEYEYALSLKKPVFACVMDESIIDTRVAEYGRKILELENPPKFNEFRAAVMTKVCQMWKDSKDIKLTIFSTLGLLAGRDGLIGWVRANTQSENLSALTDELARLSKENSQLRESKPREETFAGITFSDWIPVLNDAGILDFLITRRKQLSNGIPQSDEVLQLSSYGLLHMRPSGWFTLTDAGIAFLNRWEAEQRRSKVK